MWWWHLLTLRRITITVFVINLLLTSFTAYIFLSRAPPKAASPDNAQNSPANSKVEADFSKVLPAKESDDYWNPWGADLIDEKRANLKQTTETASSSYSDAAANQAPRTLEIWSKAAIGFYLWGQILKGRIDKRTEGGHYLYGFKRIKNYKIKFRSGPTVSVHSLRQFLMADGTNIKKNIVIVLNGRSEEKVKFAKTWLDELRFLVQKVPSNTGLILLGNENCFNGWIRPYLASNGGPLKFAFVVYDWKGVDEEEIYQWPLGVATYRNFPNVESRQLNLELQREYTCNFLGTVYPGGSRQELMEIVAITNEKHTTRDDGRGPCFTKTRKEWQPSETEDTLNRYVEALRFTDLTLSPIGMNHECYRIYEAMAFGSIPVIEENLDHVRIPKTNCDQDSAYRMLKAEGAPVMFVKNWTLELPQIIERELTGRLESKIQRRKNLVKWYTNFKITLRDKFLAVVGKKFDWT